MAVLRHFVLGPAAGDLCTGNFNVVAAPARLITRINKPFTATIEDVARKAGVSISTVSNVLNGREARMRSETIARVRDTLSNLDVPTQPVGTSAQDRPSGDDRAAGAVHRQPVLRRADPLDRGSGQCTWLRRVAVQYPTQRRVRTGICTNLPGARCARGDRWLGTAGPGASCAADRARLGHGQLRSHGATRTIDDGLCQSWTTTVPVRWRPNT